MTAATIGLGTILSAIWITLGVLYLRENWPTLPQLSPDQVFEILLAESGAVAFFWLCLGHIWLVVGYFYQGGLIRRNSALLDKALTDAARALQLVETESHKQRHYQRSRVRAAQPRWEVIGCIAYKELCEINLRNLGAPASNLSIWVKDLPIVAMLSNATFVDRGHDLTIKVIFKTSPLEEFDFTLEYCDAAGEQRTAQVQASAVGATIRQEEF